MTINMWKKQLSFHNDSIFDTTVEYGCLVFNAPNLDKNKYITMFPNNYNYSNIVKKYKDNNVIKHIDKICDIKTCECVKLPISIKKIEKPNLHSILSKKLKGKGIIDMLIKEKNSNKTIIPIELESITDIINEACNFENYNNKNYKLWNAFLLIDIRPVLGGHSQRNQGFHYDGLNIGGKYKNMPLVSIYSWCNKLPTSFYNGVIKFPKNFTPLTNGSIEAHKQVKKSNIKLGNINVVSKFDGTTLHSGTVSSQNIEDRVFIRICFTPPNMYFDRIGNTINPHIKYKYNWRNVEDPSIKFRHNINFNSPTEFKNMWNVACNGHIAFSVSQSGKNSQEYYLINKVRNKSPKWMNIVYDLYDEEIEFWKTSSINKSIALEIKKRILKLKYEI